jgi:hypothetical protein
VSEPDDDPGERTGELLGIPYDVRKPTVARVKSRMWNPEDARLFTPKVLGWGWTVNAYWLVHPGTYLRQRRRSPSS